MKKVLFILSLIGMVFLCYSEGLSQVQNTEKKVKKEGRNRVNKNIDKGIDQGYDEIEKGIGNIFKKKKKTKNDTLQTSQQSPSSDKHSSAQNEDQDQASQATLNWAKYDFIPGDKVIFEDNLEGEENGEFPSRWDLVKGTIENAQLGDDNIIMFRGGGPMIIPYLENSKEDYLPEVFTIEFDLYMNNHNYFNVYFFDKKNQRSTSDYRSLDINYQGLSLSPAKSNIPNNGSIENQWAHIAIAYTKGKLKAYINETRLINIPHLAFNPTGISLYAYHGSDHNVFYIKNFRLAEGGIKYYDRLMQDGKIIANGIRFDSGKASLKPESMGIINKIVTLMMEHPELQFSIEGHTDSDGNEETNLNLSEQRAKTVRNTIIKLGISEDRLSYKGLGESMPIDNNNSPEGKANNRRVEFVKKTIP